ncbi:MAG: hypothetical protein FWE38_05350 [Firmicutes bacterium]|nr:hypothetical protein [Bacillota bacterium]
MYTKGELFTTVNEILDEKSRKLHRRPIAPVLTGGGCGMAPIFYSRTGLNIQPLYGSSTKFRSCHYYSGLAEAIESMKGMVGDEWQNFLFGQAFDIEGEASRDDLERFTLHMPLQTVDKIPDANKYGYMPYSSARASERKKMAEREQRLLGELDMALIEELERNNMTNMKYDTGSGLITQDRSLVS